MSAEIVGVVGTLAGTILGWVLGEVTAFRKERSRAKMLKRALMSELAEMYRWIERGRPIYRQGLQLLILGAVPTTLAIKIPTHIYEEHFAEIAAELTFDERMSLNSIYSLVAQINKDTAQAAGLRHDLLHDSKYTKDLVAAFELICSNGFIAEHQILYHIEHQDSFRPGGQGADQVRALDEKTGRWFEELKAEARTTTAEEIAKRVV